MTTLDNDINQHFQDAIDVIQQHTVDTGVPGPYDWNEPTPWPHVRVDDPLGPPVPMEYPQFYPITQRKGRKKLRLYEFLHEALGDPNTADSIQWTDRGTGTFHFISKNKEKLAECWGQRKGNRKTMTYQKMARALRNYSRTGEIVKVRRKLTYQFNPTILDRLGGIGHPVPSTGHSGVGHPGREVLLHQQHNPAEQSYYSSTAALDWHSWYGQYALQGDYELAPSFPSSTVTKI
ncbi:transcription factor Spi-C isoform X2 [Esox lucius]|uniref:transcription factor Spi-C isoform X2 n=1 Tax=Esox lucius TaxID=8010 RepID=UPI001477245C|nr:transcription factor Spi-C isoform X2 [Esox lucius]